MNASDPPPALTAFLRGIEPRAKVLARAQGGPGLDATVLLAAVREEFSLRAPRLPLAEWPRRYWGLLLARAELASPSGPMPPHPLYQLSPTRRLALLLRLVIGLEPAGAARVLGLAESAYRALAGAAEEQLAELGVGPAVLVRWQQGFQHEVRAGVIEPAATRAPRPAPAKPATPTRWALVAVAAVLLLVLAATFVWPPTGPAAPAAPVAPVAPLLGLDPAPTARRDLTVELVVDPDFSLLAAPAAEPWREGVGFLGWWASELGMALPAPPAAVEPTAASREWAALTAEAQALLTPVRGAWPALDGEAQAALLAQVEAWRGLDPAGREALRAAYAQWLALPALQRSELRNEYAQWRALDAGERAALTAAAAALAALPPEQQQARRATFAALDPQVRQDWKQGPRLGRQLPGLRPLLLHLPAVEQAALIDAIEALDEPRRVLLAKRLAALGAAERAALRGRVLAVPAAERTALLAAAAGSP